MNQQKGFYKNFFNIYVALVLQNVITISVNLADNVMLGAYSEIALSGAAAVNQIQFVYQQLLLALGDGLVIFCSQYWGKKQTGPMKKIAATAMYAAIFIAVVLFGLVSFFPYQAVGIFTTDGPIIESGLIYLNDAEYFPLQLILRNILVLGQKVADDAVNADEALAALRRAELLKYCLIVVSSVPMFLIYPFIQKYFVKGIMIGSVKG